MNKFEAEPIARSALSAEAPRLRLTGPAAADAPNIAGLSVDPRKIVAMVRRRLRLMAALAAAVFIAVVIFTLQATPLYTATANVMLDVRKEQVVDTAAVLSGLPADSSVVDTEVEILKSRQLADRVVTQLKLDQDPEFNPALREPGPVGAIIGGVTGLFKASAPQGAQAHMSEVEAQKLQERVVDNVLSKLSVRRAGLTYVINVSFESENPTKAARIANTFADLYLLEQLEAKFDATRQANQWLNTRLSELRDQVQQAEAAVTNYRIQNNLLSTSGATLTEQEISNYNQLVAQHRAQLAEAEARLRTARAQLAGGSTGEDVGEALLSKVIQDLRVQRGLVSARAADLRGRYGTRHPELLKVERELADVDAQIQQEVQRIISNLEAQVTVARQRAASVVGSLTGARATLANNNQAAVRLGELERNAESVRTLYESYLTRFKETSAQQGIEASDARVVSRAAIPTGPSSPNVLLNMALGLVLAGGAAVAGLVAAEAFDNGLSTAEDVERRLDTPHLGSLPLLGSVAEERGVSPAQYVVNKPLSSFAESFRALRTSIHYSKLGEPVRTVVFTSALPGEGKTTTAVCLGRSAALAGDRVVVVDCDLRRRNVNKLIGVEPAKGLLDVLSGQAKLDDVLLTDEESGAVILPLAHSSFTPKDVFGTPAMDKLLDDLAARYDLVILDTAPALAVSDTRVLAEKADVVVFLARWRRTPAKAVENALKLLVASGAHLGGVALTLVDMKQQVRYGYGDPGYYYAQYKKYYAA